MKLKSVTFVLWLGAALAVSSIQFNGYAQQPTLTSISGAPLAYKTAVENAAVPKVEDVFNDLIVVNRRNTSLVWNSKQNRILVVAWKGRSDFEHFYKNEHETSRSEDHVTWVTIAPQVQKFCQEFLKSAKDASALDLRLKQYLGLSPDHQYDVVVEMWVRPADLFRPCPDPEITDSKCELKLADRSPKVRHIRNYNAFYRNLYYGSFRNSPGVPWTGLGYTYDWGNPSRKTGASEFILVPGAHYAIDKKDPRTTQQYCSNPN